MKKHLVIIAVIAAIGAGNAYAVIKDRSVSNDSDYVVFVAWKNMVGSKSTYIRLLPGDKYTFDAVERGYGVKGLYGNTIQVELGEKVGRDKTKIENYRSRVDGRNKKLDPELSAVITATDPDNVVITIH